MLEKLKEKLQERLNSIRSLRRIVYSDEFKEAFETSGQVQRERVLSMIEREDKSGIESWFNSKKSLAEKSVRDLRSMCKDRNIKNYHLLTKAELLSVLERRDDG